MTDRQGARTGARPGRGGDARLELIGLGLSLFILCAVAAIRLPRESLWLDEAYTRAAANDFWFDLRTFRGTMVLYMVIVRAWSTLSSAAWWLRMPSVLFAGGALIALRPIARRIGGPRLVLVALPATALLSGFQWVATDARAYGLELLLTVLAWYVCLAAGDATGPSSARRWWVLALLGSLGVATHGLFVLQLVPIAAIVILRDGPRHALRHLLPTVVSSSVTLGVFVVLGTPTKNGTFVTGGASAWVGSTLTAFTTADVLVRLVVAQVVLIALVGVYLACKARGLRRSWLRLVPAAWCFLPCIALGLVSWVTPTYNPRYVLAVLPAVGLLLGQGVIALGDRLTPRGDPKAARTFAVCAGALAVVLSWGAVSTPYQTHADWRGIAHMVAADARPGDAIVFADSWGQFPQFTRPPFEEAWSERHRAVTPVAISPTRPLGRVRSHDFVLAPSAVADRATRHPRVWIVQERGPGVPDRIGPITSDRRMAGYVRIGAWDYPDSIRLELWQRVHTTD